METKFLLINEKSGGVARAGVSACVKAVQATAPDADWQIEIANGEPAALTARAQDAALTSEAHKDIYVIAGDGTTAAVAGAIHGAATAIAPLPGGTMNAFARDLGYDTDLMTAIEQISVLQRRKVDIAFASGRAFLNNVVFGAYAALADSREQLREADNLIETAEAVQDIVGSLAFAEADRYRINSDGEEQTINTNTVMAAHNLYTGGEFMRPTRDALDTGKLGIYAAQSKTALDFMSVLYEALTGNLGDSEEFSVSTCKRCRISSATGAFLAATIDGEALELPSPVDIEIKHKALNVLAPPS